MSIIEPARLAHSLPEQIADQIAAAIIDESFAPGHRLKEIALAESFGVSRAPVREALRMLESRGLIRISPQRGAQVTELTVDDVVELFQIRAVLIGLAAACVTRRAEPAALDALDASVRELERLASRNNRSGYQQASYALTILTAASSGSERLHTMVTSFAQQTARYTRLALASKAQRIASSQSWRATHDAMLSGDAARAEACARAHVERTGETAVALLSAGEQGRVTGP